MTPNYRQGMRKVDPVPFNRSITHDMYTRNKLYRLMTGARRE